MSKLFLTLTLLVAAPAMADEIAFLPGTTLQTGLQEAINLEYGKQCPKVMWSREVVTLTAAQGGVEASGPDFYYETTVDAAYDFDGSHPIHTTITIRSVDQAGSGANPRFVVQSIVGDGCNGR